MGRGGESFVGAKEDERKRHVFGREGRKGREEGSSATTHARRKLVLRGRHLRPGRENIDRGGGTERLEQVERKGHCFALAGDHLFLQAGRRAAKDQGDSSGWRRRTATSSGSLSRSRPGKGRKKQKKNTQK